MTFTRTMPDHADHASAQTHLEAKLARVRPGGYNTTHIATVRGMTNEYLHLFDVVNHMKTAHVAHRIAVVRMIGGLWEVVS